MGLWLRTASVAAADGLDHPLQLWYESGARPCRPVDPNGANKRARVVERQRRHVGAEVSPHAILHEILLDVRQIEGRHGRAPVLGIAADGANRLRAREIPYDGHDEVPALQALHEPKDRLA